MLFGRGCIVVVIVGSPPYTTPRPLQPTLLSQRGFPNLCRILPPMSNARRSCFDAMITDINIKWAEPPSFLLVSKD